MACHGSLIGTETGKIISVGTRIMACRVCATRSGDLSKSKHNCRIVELERLLEMMTVPQWQWFGMKLTTT